MPTLNLNVNGKDHAVTVNDPSMPLLWVLRDLIGLTGTKYGCGIEICGACTVLVDNQPEKSCDMDVTSAVGKRITTIEGLSADRSHPAQQAWIAKQVPQCGYCQSGMLMAVAGAMKAGHHGSEIANELSNICVCGTYQRIKQAVAGL
ncbi:MAG: (2Fe-2S)-binding protein [Ideonella sp.]|jgi:isoquinoline 1-oxidoreductase subunit alpha|nr:(2Fe-2S)-binding protein [Ideonella sp.]